MTVSSRTPEGLPSHCPLCDTVTALEFSDPAGDAPCPNCGCLLWQSTELLEQFRKRLASDSRIPIEEFSAATNLRDLVGDSLDTVELVMALEEEFDINIPDEDAERITTVGEAIRYILQQRRQSES